MGQIVDHLLATVLAVDEVVHYAASQRARPVEGACGDHVLEAGGLELDQHLLHAAGFELEDAGGVARGDQVIAGLVVVPQAGDVELRVLSLPHQFDGVLDHGEVLEPQEVEFHQADHLNVLHGVLGVDGAGLLVLVDRQELLHLLRGHHHPGGVGAGVTGQAFQADGGFQQLLHLGVGRRQLLQLRLLLHGLVQGHVQVVRDQFGDPVHVPVGHIERPAHVPHHGLGLHGPEGDDLADTLPPVFLHHVLDDLFPAVLAEVNVDIGHGDAFRVEEALEQQVVGQGVQVGDLDGVSHQRTGGRTPAGTDRDPLVLGPVDEVGHDQEVGRELHLADAVQLDAQAVEVGLLPFQGHVGILGQDGGHALLEPLRCKVFQHLVVALAGRGLEVGEIVFLVQGEFQVATLGDGHGVGDGLGRVGKGPRHLLRRLDVELVRRELHVGRVAHGLAGLDAEQHLVSLGILPVQVVAVVGGHQGQLQFACHLQQALVDHLLLGQGVFLQLDVITVREDLAVPAGRGHGIFHPSPAALHGHLALEAGRQGEKPPGMFLQDLPVDAGTVVEPFLEAGRGEVGEVLVPLHVPAEQDQVVGRVGDPLSLFGEAGFGGQVDLAADERLDAGLLALEVELDGAEHVAVVGDGQGRHVILLCLVDQVLDADGAVQQGVLGMEVEMDEGRGG